MPLTSICGSPGLARRPLEACFPTLLRARPTDRNSIDFFFCFSGFTPRSSEAVSPFR
jgi:hypothetical protein